MTQRRRPAPGGFDRIPGRRERPASGDPQGRAALFSAPPAAEERPRRWVPGLTVSCTGCHTVSSTSPVGIMFLLLPFTVALPWRPNWVLGTCPACRRRTWLSLGVRW